MRFVSIDLLRASAMVIMVIVHFCENLAGYTPLIAGVGAPLFMFLSGVSYQLWLNGQRTRKSSESQITKVSLRRGLFLFGLGFAFNILVWSPEDVFNWDILTLIGTGLMILAFARNLPAAILLTFGAGLILLAPVVAKMADWESFWQAGYFDPELTFADVALGFLATGYFPVFPWISFPLIGFAVASLLFSANPPEANPKHGNSNPNAVFRPFSNVGLALMGLSCFLIIARNCVPSSWLTGLPQGWTTFPPSLEYLLAIMGFTLFAFVNLYRWIDRPKGDRSALQHWISPFSKYSLSFYLLHHVAHLWPLWIYGALWAEHPHDYWQKATSVPVALVLAGIFLVASFWLLRGLDRHQGPSIEKLMRWLCD